MLLRIAQNLYVGNTEGLVFTNKKDWIIIHACQSYHYKIMNWSRLHNKPNKNHQNYLIYENEKEMSLNWVDGGSHLYDWYGTEKFIYILDFIESKVKTHKVFIHCDHGKSRSPSLALLFLAKRLKIINNISFTLAYNDFIKLYPQYKPGGIALYIENHWDDIK